MTQQREMGSFPLHVIKKVILFFFEYLVRIYCPAKPCVKLTQFLQIGSYVPSGFSTVRKELYYSKSIKSGLAWSYNYIGD